MSSLMQLYAKLVNFLGEAFGEHGEIALLDLQNNDQQIIAIANGHISGRNVGAPVTDLALKIIADGSWKTQDYITNYTGSTQDGRNLRSSTFFIKESGKLLGMLCINVDVSSYQALSSAILKLGGILPQEQQPTDTQTVETFYQNISVAIDNSMLKLFGTPFISTDHLTMEDKIEIIRSPDENGIFKIKGSVGILAQRLQCSQPTIYRYLSKISRSANMPDHMI